MPPVGKIETPEESHVQAVRVVVHRTDATVDGRSVNHWVTYLHTEEGYVVKMNMREKTGTEWPHILFRDAQYGEPGKLDISSFDSDIVTPSMIKSWELPCVGRPQVKDFINTLIRNHRGYYTMAIGGSGCRYWVYTAINDFETQGYLTPGTTAFVQERLAGWYTRRSDLARSVVRDPAPPMPQGKFWDPAEWEEEFRRYDPFAPSSDLWLQ
ncbi:hypothetical protein TWF281_005876 [Arthrobotrys megalospora]